MDELSTLLESLPGYSSITVAMKQAALDGARIPDSFGIWPGEEGYETTYDVYFAAINLVGFLQAQPVIRQSSSEGTSVAVDAPDWQALLSYFRSQSPIVGLGGDQVIQRVNIPDPPHVVKLNMNSRDTRYGDFDTDLG